MGCRIYNTYDLGEYVKIIQQYVQKQDVKNNLILEVIRGYGINNTYDLGEYVEIIQEYVQEQDVKNNLIFEAIRDYRIYSIDDLRKYIKIIQVYITEDNKKNEILQLIKKNVIVKEKTDYYIENDPLSLFQKIIEESIFIDTGENENILINKITSSIQNNTINDTIDRLTIIELYILLQAIYCLDDNYNILCKKYFYNGSDEYNDVHNIGTLKDLLNQYQQNIGTEFFDTLEQKWNQILNTLSTKEIEYNIDVYNNGNNVFLLSYLQLYNGDLVANHPFTILLKTIQNITLADIDEQLDDRSLEIINRIDEYIINKHKLEKNIKKLNNIDNEKQQKLKELENTESNLTQEINNLLDNRFNNDNGNYNIIENIKDLIKDDQNKYKYISDNIYTQGTYKDLMKNILGERQFNNFVEKIKRKETENEQIRQI